MASKKAAVTAERKAAAVRNVTGKDTAQVVTKLAAAKVEIVKFIDQVTNEVTSKLDELKEVQLAVDAKKEELKLVHDIEVQAESLAGVQQATQDAHALFKLQNEELDRQRTREVNDYEYRKKIQRRDEEDAHKLKLAAMEKEVTDRLNLREAELNELNDNILEEGVTYQAEKQKVAQLEEGRKADIDKAVAIATNSLKKDLTNAHELALLKVTADLNQIRHELVLQKEACQALRVDNEKLKAEALAANARVQAVAEKAIEGSARQAINVHTGELAQGTKRS